MRRKSGLACWYCTMPRTPYDPTDRPTQSDTSHQSHQVLHTAVPSIHSQTQKALTQNPSTLGLVSASLCPPHAPAFALTAVSKVTKHPLWRCMCLELHVFERSPPWQHCVWHSGQSTQRSLKSLAPRSNIFQRLQLSCSRGPR